MYHQDSMLTLKDSTSSLWRQKYELQVAYSNSCDTVRNKCIETSTELKKENDQLHADKKRLKSILIPSMVINALLVLILVL